MPATVGTLPSISTDQERVFAKLKVDDSKAKHKSVRTHEAIHMYRETIFEHGNGDFTPEDMKIIRRLVRKEKPYKEEEKRIREEIAMRDKNKRLKVQQRTERRQVREKNLADALQGVQLEKDVERLQKMKGAQVDLQLKLWKQRKPLEKIRQGGKVGKKKERLLALIMKFPNEAECEEAEEQEVPSMPEGQEIQEWNQNESQEEVPPILPQETPQAIPPAVIEAEPIEQDTVAANEAEEAHKSLSTIISNIERLGATLMVSQETRKWKRNPS